MTSFEFNHEQQYAANASPGNKLFLHGPAGTGKSTSGVARLINLIHQGVPANQIIVLVPQRTLARPFIDVLTLPDFPAGSLPDVVTIGGLAQRMISLFWPMIAKEAGFANPTAPPHFLTLETAQYYMALVIQPLLEQGYFETIHLDRNRILSQILDNLNKSAAVGFSHLKIAEMLKLAWVGKPEQVHVYDEAQEVANRFRAYCLQNNLLDFSLQLQVFREFLWPSLLCRQYLISAYRHLIYDNVEEDVPIAHDILTQWLPFFDTAWISYDTDAGYRSFLGADPESGWNLQVLCDETIAFTQSWVVSPGLDQFREALGCAIRRKPLQVVAPSTRSSITVTRQPFYPQLLDWVAAEIRSLVENRSVEPGQIAVLSPFLSDTLRFQLMNRLNDLGIPNRSHRPSRSLREEPATQCLLTLARLAHPHWGLACSRIEIRMALMKSLGETLDLVRADILSQIVYRPNKFRDGLSSFAKIPPETQQRISYQAGQRFEELRNWIIQYQQNEPLEIDIFLSKLFGEVLSQPGFGFHQNLDDAAVAARLIESMQKFRQAVHQVEPASPQSIGVEYIRMVDEGVIAAQYLQEWDSSEPNAVFISPAYTFLMKNEPVAYQFWLDIGSLGWWERLYQPLTHPVVLSRRWPQGKIWTDADEHSTNQASLARLTEGLIRRCGTKIYLCSSGLDEQGNEPRGPLLGSLQIVLRRLAAGEDFDVEPA